MSERLPSVSWEARFFKWLTASGPRRIVTGSRVRFTGSLMYAIVHDRLRKRDWGDLTRAR